MPNVPAPVAVPDAIPAADFKPASPIPGFKVALLGAVGTGKTHAIRTLVDAGITPFIIFTENGMGLLGDIPAESCHWTYVKPASEDWSLMKDSANKINTLDFKALTAMPGFSRHKYNQWLQVLEACANFTCARTGENFGNISEWGTDRALVVDSLSGLNIMAMNLVTGSKPVKDMKDWGMAMDNLERFVIKLCTDLQCHMVMTAHPEREVDMVSGATKLMFSTLGKKLPPLIPRYFDEVVYTKCSGDTFFWSTTESMVDLKNRYLPRTSKLPPTFVEVLKGWEAKGGLVSPTAY
jgi:hypothetical protein